MAALTIIVTHQTYLVIESEEPLHQFIESSIERFIDQDVRVSEIDPNTVDVGESDG